MQSAWIREASTDGGQQEQRQRKHRGAAQHHRQDWVASAGTGSILDNAQDVFLAYQPPSLNKYAIL